MTTFLYFKSCIERGSDLLALKKEMNALTVAY